MWSGMDVSGFELDTRLEHLTNCSQMTNDSQPLMNKSHALPSWWIFHRSARTKANADALQQVDWSLIINRSRLNSDSKTTAGCVLPGIHGRGMCWMSSLLRRNYELDDQSWARSGVRDPQTVLMPCGLLSRTRFSIREKTRLCRLLPILHAPESGWIGTMFQYSKCQWKWITDSLRKNTGRKYRAQ